MMPHPQLPGLLLLLLLLLLPTQQWRRQVSALDNGAGLKPPLGWSSWYVSPLLLHVD